jgi:hypothetical protein
VVRNTRLSPNRGKSTSKQRKAGTRHRISVASMSTLVVLIAMFVVSATTAFAGTERRGLGAYGVSCTSASFCAAVGQGTDLLSSNPKGAKWNGTEWITVEEKGFIENGSAFEGVSCPAVRECIAVGGPGAPFVEKLESKGWEHLSTFPGERSLTSVSCTAAYVCETVGTEGLIEATKKLSEGWKEQKSAKVTEGAELQGVSCSTSTACTAVGYTHEHTKALAERWNGTEWALQTAVSPATEDQLASVSCYGEDGCIAVGWSGASAKEKKPLTERWNGTEWKTLTTPSPTKGGQLSGVSCTSATACMAVGAIGKEKAEGTLSESWNGTEWTIKATPAAIGLYSVSCWEAKGCTAVGKKNESGEDWIAATWNGTEWKGQKTPVL